MPPRTIAWLTLLATLAFGLSPIFISPFSGYTADQLPIFDPDPAIQPAGYAFSIWGVIYTWLAVSAIFGVVSRSDNMNWSTAQLCVLPALIIGAAWTWIASNSAIWGTITIWMMLISALAGTFQAPWQDKWWLKAPYALFAGWLSAAAFVSLGVALPGYGIGFGATTWAIIGILAAATLASIMQIRMGQMPFYGVAVIWAFIGIIAGNSAGTTSIYLSACIGIGIVAASTVLAIKTAKTTA
ncbi:MAG: hypothetical protein ACPG5U_06500 [Planktomarina sp.]